MTEEINDSLWKIGDFKRVCEVHARRPDYSVDIRSDDVSYYQGLSDGKAGMGRAALDMYEDLSLVIKHYKEVEQELDDMYNACERYGVDIDELLGMYKHEEE